MVTVDPHLTPDDAAVALASFPRRFRGLLARPEDDEAPDADPDELARRYGSDGHSAVEHLLAAGAVADAIPVIVGPPSRAGALPASAAAPEALAPADDRTPVDTLLEGFAQSCDRAARAVRSTTTDDWAGDVAVEGGDERPDRLSLLRRDVAVISDHLRAAERVLAEVR